MIYEGVINLPFKLTGVSTPFGGLSWEVTDSEKRVIQKLFYFLESKRILTNPASMELANQCIISALEIKGFIVNLLGDFHFSKATETVLKNMCDACNSFLDGLNQKERAHIIYKNGHGDWCDNDFSAIMKSFRSVFRTNIQVLKEHFNIVFSKDIPEEY